MNQGQKDKALARGLVKTKIVSVVKEATILREGWEADNKGWVVACADGSTAALTTDHGSICHWTLGDLQNSLEETKQSVLDLEECLQLLNKA